MLQLRKAAEASRPRRRGEPKPRELWGSTGKKKPHRRGNKAFSCKLLKVEEGCVGTTGPFCLLV